MTGMTRSNLITIKNDIGNLRELLEDLATDVEKGTGMDDVKFQLDHILDEAREADEGIKNLLGENNDKGGDE